MYSTTTGITVDFRKRLKFPVATETHRSTFNSMFFLVIADLLGYKSQNKIDIIYCALIIEIFHINILFPGKSSQHTPLFAVCARYLTISQQL